MKKEENVTIQMADGAVYTGEAINGAPHGKGRCVWPNGNVYKGEWVKGKREGFGFYYWAGGAEYYGDWKDDAMSGVGNFLSGDGEFYEGHWLNGKKHGYGKYTHRDKTVEEGVWQYDALLDPKQFDPAVFQKLTLEAKCADLFSRTTDIAKRLKILEDAYWQASNAGYCDAMASKLSCDCHDAQTDYWNLCCSLTHEIKELIALYKKELK